MSPTRIRLTDPGDSRLKQLGRGTHRQSLWRERPREVKGDSTESLLLPIYRIVPEISTAEVPLLVGPPGYSPNKANQEMHGQGSAPDASRREYA